MSENYIESLNKEYIIKLRNNIKILPSFVGDFFRGINDTTAIRTRMVYSYDLIIFFKYLIKEEPMFYKENIRDFTIEDFKNITVTHIEEFMDYLSYYTKNEKDKDMEITNGQTGKNRKLSSIRSLYHFLLRRGIIEKNPSELILTPKIKDKNITYLEVNEVANLLDEVDKGDNLTKSQKNYHNKTRERDLAIIMLILGTGMRISECVGINLNDIDFELDGVKITRKGGNQSIVYFNEEVREALFDYLDVREKISPLPEHEAALFLSLQNKRIGQRSVQNLVKKYSQIATPLKNISPHKLRSTYGTHLYRESGDIYLVADALGHKDVNTTRKHYANMDDARRRQAAKYVNLRKS